MWIAELRAEDSYGRGKIKEEVKHVSKLRKL